MVKVLDAQNLENLMKEHGDSILRMCYLYLKDYQLAEDATQETFIKAIRAYNSFRHKADEKTWLTRIAINCCKDIMRTRWFQLSKVSYDESNIKSTEEPIETLIEKNSISESIMKLKRSDREIILLYYYKELSIKEIAIFIRKSENTTIQRLNRARGRLKKILAEVGYEEPDR